MRKILDSNFTLPRLLVRTVAYNFLVQRTFLAALAGAVWSLAFPLPGISILAWLVPSLLCLLGFGLTSRAALFFGFIAGLTFNLLSLKWLLAVPVGWSACVHWLLLCFSLAPYPAIWTWFCRETSFRAPREENDKRLQQFGLSDLGVLQSIYWTITCAAGWAVLEFIQSSIFTGFPWNLLGSSQFEFLPYIQLASITGTSGLSFLIVWNSLSFLYLICSLTAKNPAPKFIPFLTSGCFLLAVLTMGNLRVARAAPVYKVIRCALVQPGGRFDDIGDMEQRQERFSSVVKLSCLINPQTTDLILWPEGGVAKMLRWDGLTESRITGLARNNKINLIICAVDAEIITDKNDNLQLNRYNAAFLIDDRGRIVSTYKKQHLVPWHEYTPVKFFKFLMPIANDFTPGLQPMVFDIKSLDIRTSVLICIEDIFAPLARERAALNLDFLVDLGDDGWFGLAAAQKQHLASSALRAVECQVPLLRCTANGLTCLVDAYGHICQSLPVGEPGVLFVDLPLIKRSERSPTFYQNHGDWFPWTCLLWIIITMLYAARPHFLAFLGGINKNKAANKSTK